MDGMGVGVAAMAHSLLPMGRTAAAVGSWSDCSPDEVMMGHLHTASHIDRASLSPTWEGEAVLVVVDRETENLAAWEVRLRDWAWFLASRHQPG